MHNILIVDDEKYARDYISELVSFYIPNSKITLANSASSALNRLRVNNFDLMFVDIDFGAGKMTGLDLLKEIKLLGKQIYSVIISAHYKFEYVVKSMELGATRYIPKPLKNNNFKDQEMDNIVCVDKPLYKDKVYDAIKLYLNKVKTDIIEVRVPDGIRRVQISRIIAIETIGRGKVKIYCNDFILPEVANSLNSLHQLLPDNFRYILRNCVVNALEVKHYNLKFQKVFINCRNKEYSLTASRSNLRELIAFLNPDNTEKDDE